MKKMKNLWLVMLVIALAFGMAACGEEDGEEEEEPIEEFTGTYTTTYASSQAGGSTTETVKIALKSFKISDSTGASLDFSVDNWEVVKDIPAAASDYTDGFKFTGKITAAEPQSGADSYIGSTKTAPGFVAGDIGNTEAWMYIYFNYDKNAEAGNKYTFVRSPFSKATKDNGKNAITGSETPPKLRVYKK
ncbi:MAG: hypothetical protein LBI04_11880 [Treponema sp.]|jgi:hypothetical protein|nr:hypothetical protein [Treponema sp.]